MTSDRPVRPPTALLSALLLLLVEVGALLALTVGMLLEVVRGQSTGGAVTAVLAALFLGLCAVLVAAGRALYQRHRWGRGPVVTWQLLLLATGVSQAGALEWWVVTLLVAFPVAVTVGILLPRSVEWTSSATPPRAVA
ncbi:hypothetical protein FHE66_10050 [Georgenia sp. 311]|uniref:Histidine kinase n=1 Tax=Georgenia wutianyii TaxID=2585135 RepID=A0ABX5VJR0_9MICO|nr:MULTISPECIES: hypothetical protein [Georgenia]QDB78672.1 hypothetical protein FE251_04225 [Georgenia wutianyii]TNC17475.1 hypothetical protein FHE66_10050 [Georgenia sp. 311]